MWETCRGPCNCFFCISGVEHPAKHAQYGTRNRGHLQVANSLNPQDIVRTVMCPLCTHETPAKSTR